MAGLAKDRSLWKQSLSIFSYHLICLSIVSLVMMMRVTWDEWWVIRAVIAPCVGTPGSGHTRGERGRCQLSLHYQKLRETRRTFNSAMKEFCGGVGPFCSTWNRYIYAIPIHPPMDGLCSHQKTRKSLQRTCLVSHSALPGHDDMRTCVSLIMQACIAE